MKVGENRFLRADGQMTAHGRSFYVGWIAKLHKAMKDVGAEDGTEVEAAILIKLALDIATRSAIVMKGAKNDRPEVGDYWMVVEDGGRMDPVCFRVMSIANGIAYFDDESYAPVASMMRKIQNWVRIQSGEAIRDHGSGPRRKNTRGTA